MKKKTVRGEPRNQRERRGRARERTRACLDVPPFRARVSLYLCFAHSRTRRHWNKSGDASKDSREKNLSVFVAFFQFIFGKKNSRRKDSRVEEVRVEKQIFESRTKSEREREKEKERKMRPPPSWPSWKKKKKKIVERTRDDVEKEQQKKVFHGIKCLKKQLKKALNFEVGKLKRRINTIESSASGNKNTTEKTKEITTEKQLVAAKTISVEDLEVLAKMLADACFKQIVSKKEEKGKGKFLLSSGDDEKKKKKKKEEEKEVIEAKELVARRVVHAKCVNEEMESLKARILLVQTRATQIEEARKRSEERLEKKKKKKEDAAKRRAQEEEDKKTKKNGDRNSFDIKKKKKKKRSESVSSGSESDDEEEEQQQQQLSSAGEESDDSISLSEETRQAMREAREGAMQKKKKRKKIIDVDDDDNDDPLKSAPLSPPKKKQKARMGQRQRRLLAEQQYGKNAKHVIAEQQKAEEERRKAEEELRTMHPSWKAKRMDAKKPMIIPLNGKGKGKKVVFDHDGGDRKNLAAKVKVNDDKPLHPSWSAKLKQDQEAWSGGAVPFQGKKKTFE